jgi:hypothetical protein
MPGEGLHLFDGYIWLIIVKKSGIAYKVKQIIFFFKISLLLFNFKHTLFSILPI